MNSLLRCVAAAAEPWAATTTAARPLLLLLRGRGRGSGIGPQQLRESLLPLHLTSPLSSIKLHLHTNVPQSMSAGSTGQQPCECAASFLDSRNLVDAQTQQPGHDQEAARELDADSDGAAAQVPLVPGTFFRVAAGKSSVRVEHVAGWSDVAALRGQPAGGGAWRVTPGGAGPAASGGTAEALNNLPGIRLVYDVQPDDVSSGGGGGGGGGRRDGGAAGLVRLAVPEKWISFDISTEGCPVSVSRLVEADLRVATGGAALTLGSVRGLCVELDTTAASSSSSSSSSSSGSSSSGGSGQLGPHSGAGGDADDGGAVTGREVSGTSVSIAAGGHVSVRRLVGGTMRVTTTATATVTTSATAGTDAAPTNALMTAAPPGKAAVELGAAYGGRLQIRTGGGAVRVGTLDCGGYATGPPVGGGGGAVGGGGSTDISERSGTGGARGGGGADIMSYGGAVTLDGLEGDAVVDSGGGPVNVLVQARLRTATLHSGGGAVDVALDPGAALALLEVRGAAQLLVDPGLQTHLEVFAADGATEDGGGSAQGSAVAAQGPDTAPVGVWRARVASEPEGARGGTRGADPAASGRLVVEADGGCVSVRRLGWMEALRAKMAERAQQAQHAQQAQQP